MSAVHSSSPQAMRPDGEGGALPLPDVCTALEAASYLRLGAGTPESARDAMNRLRRDGLVNGFSHGKNRPLLFLREELVAAARKLAMGNGQEAMGQTGRKGRA